MLSNPPYGDLYKLSGVFFPLYYITCMQHQKKNHFSKAIISETLQRIKSYVKRTTSTKHRGNEGMRHRKKWRRII